MYLPSCNSIPLSFFLTGHVHFKLPQEYPGCYQQQQDTPEMCISAGEPTRMPPTGVNLHIGMAKSAFFNK